MANIILNQQAEAELKKLGFHNKRMPTFYHDGVGQDKS